MASLSREKQRSGAIGWRIVWTNSEGKQKALRVGIVSKRTAERVLILVERLLELRRFGLPLDSETARWVASLDEGIAERLARLGLIAPRKAIALGQYLQEWIASLHCKESSKAARLPAVNDLIAFFTPSKPIREITPEEASAFRQYLIDRGLRPATIAKRLEHARSAFRRAVLLGLLDRNPFELVKQKAGNVGERRQYVPAETVERLLPHCPDWTWRLLLVLARYGGLRVPSEPFSLRWSDILWDEGKMIIDSPKTGLRVMPLFPRVRVALDEAWEFAEPGAVYVIPEKYRLQARGPLGFRNVNLRNGLLAIIRKAGETPWPRVWHNLRASCETDLINRYPLPIVARWLGNSSAIAYKHYVEITDSHFRAATQEDPWTLTEGEAKGELWAESP
jgi:integrase